MASNFLAAILADKQREVVSRRAQISEDDLWERSASQSPPLPAIEALRSANLEVLAEVKRGSPSGGMFDANLDAAEQAVCYASAGAAAVSILTDAPYFSGTLEDLARARVRTAVPLLRKDFIIDRYQVLEARAYGADLVLLIVAALDQERLEDLLHLTHELGMSALVEVNTAREAAIADASGAALVGINNRDLHTFVVDLATTETVRPLLRTATAVAALSGVRTTDDARRMRLAGVDAVLVGEALVRSSDPAVLIREMRSIQ